MKTHQDNLAVCGWSLLGLCLIIRYVIGRRRFNRRGVAGLQQFSSYRRFITVTTIERVVLLIGNACGLSGLILLAFAGIHHFNLQRTY